MDPIDLIICKEGRAVAYWHEFIARGEEVSGNALSHEQSYRLVRIFMHACSNPAFARALIERPVTIMFSEAVFSEGKGEHSLDDVGDICLMRAGFPNLLSTRVRKVMHPNASTFLVKMGRGCFSQLRSAYEVRGKKATGLTYQEYVDGFIRMVEVLWASCGMHPDLFEVFEISRMPGASYAKKILDTSAPFLVPGNATKQ